MSASERPGDPTFVSLHWTSTAQPLIGTTADDYYSQPRALFRLMNPAYGEGVAKALSVTP